MRSNQASRSALPMVSRCGPGSGNHGHGGRWCCAMAADIGGRKLDRLSGCGLRRGRVPVTVPRSASSGLLENWSGRRGSNPRPRPWQGRALPLSYTRIRKKRGGRRPRRQRQTYGKCRRRMQCPRRGSDHPKFVNLAAEAGKPARILPVAGQGPEPPRRPRQRAPLDGPAAASDSASRRWRMRPDGTDRLARLAVFDSTLAGGARPNLVEIANDFPDLRRRLLKTCAVIGLAIAPSAQSSLISRRGDPDHLMVPIHPISDHLTQGTRLNFATRPPSRLNRNSNLPPGPC